ncbi:MAG: hypothetical protein CVU67_05965, partial [Deltaproteobacteria bacterium HGW-Deltaproteobacteria-24]
MDWENIYAAIYRAKKEALKPVKYLDEITLEDLVGIEKQKEEIVENTQRFLNGLPANNVLLWGARGTGKSSLIKAILNEYKNVNFKVRISNPHGVVAKALNSLADTINDMLVESKSNGLTLEESSNILLSNVDKLNISSNEAAASLEETAAAIEEITSNIRNNTENIAKMATYSNRVTSSANDGEKLATQTTQAMDEI